MEKHWIYVRTAAGEGKLEMRARLAHQDLRALLARVDGVSSVAALKRQIGDGDLVERSLSELERLGLVEQISGDEPSRSRQRAVRSAAGRRRAERRRGGWLKGWDERRAEWQRRSQARREERAFLRAYEANPSDEIFAPVKLKPFRRAPRRKANWLARAALALSIVAACALLLLVAFPYGSYRQEVEQRLGSAFGEKVSVSSIAFSFQPYPNLTLSGVSIGSGCEVGAMRLVPAPSSLFGGAWVIAHAQFESLDLRGKSIAASGRWFSSTPAASGGVVLQRVSLENLSLDVDGARLHGLNGEMQMSAAGRMVKLQLRDAVRGLSLEATPTGSGYRFSLAGTAAKLPLVPDLVFETLAAHGKLSAEGLRVDDFEAGLYGGSLAATAALDWSRGARLEADATFSHASSSRLASALDSELSLDGEMSGKLRFEASAAELARIGDKLQVEGSFVAGRGQVMRFDLMEALRGTRRTRGGYTRFEGLSGALRRDASGLHLRNLSVDGGALQATGALHVDRNSALSGRLEIELKGPVLRVRGSAAVGGTLAEPQLSIARIERR